MPTAVRAGVITDSDAVPDTTDLTIDDLVWHRGLVRFLEWSIALVGIAVAVGVGALSIEFGEVAALIAVTTVGLIVLLRRPHLATLIVVGLIYSNAAVVAVRFHGVPLVVGASVPLLLAIPLAFHLIVNREPVVATRYVRPLALLLLAHLVATIGADPGGDALTWFFTFVVEGIGLFFMLLNVVRTPAMLDRVITVIVLVAAVLGLISLTQQVTGTFENNYLGFAQVNETLVQLTPLDYALLIESDAVEGQPRLAGSIGEKNYYAFLMVVVLPLAIYLASHSPTRRLRVIAGVSAPLIGAGVVLSFSRGAAVGFGIATITLALLGIIRRRLLIPIALITVAALVAVPGYRDRLTTLVNITNVGEQRASSSAEADTAIQGRYSEMVSAGYVMLDNPVFGVGPGQFRHHFLGYSSRLGFAGIHDEPREAHNLYLGLGAETGVMGLGALLVFLGRLWVDLRKRVVLEPSSQQRALAVALLLSLTTFCVSGMFLHMAYARYSFMLLALAAAFAHVTQTATGSTSTIEAATDSADS